MTCIGDLRLPLSSWEHVEEHPSGCLLWTNPLTKDGYGVAPTDLTEHGTTTAHRVAYVALVGPIPKGHHVDHLCHGVDCLGAEICLHRRCVKGEHLEAVTPLENIRRARALRSLPLALELTHCTRAGHEYTEENTKWVRKGGVIVKKQCRACAKAADQRYRARVRSVVT